MNARIKNLFFIFFLGSLSASLLIGTESFTRPVIERHATLKLKSTILDTAGISYTQDNMYEVFDRTIKRIEKGGFTYYVSPKGLYIFIFKDRGLWGMIKGAIALKPDMKTIENIRIIFQEETPGLGGRITERSFLNQFRGKRVSPHLILALRSKATAINEVDAITGASMTSRALIDMINKSVINFREVASR